IFEKNLVVNSQAMQIFMAECNSSCATMGPWEIRNNIYVGIGGQANFGIPNIHFYNNTLYNSGNNNRLVLYLYDTPGKSDYSGAQIKNNLFAVSASITRYSQVVSVGSTGTNLAMNNNYITTIGTYVAVSGFSESSGINGGNPGFVDAATNNFH